MHATEDYVQVADMVRLYCRVVGEGPETVIVPGASIAEDLEPLAEGRRIIFYDQRGRGRSDAVKDDSLVWTEYEPNDLERVRRHFAIERISLIGWSYLGGVAVLYTMRHTHRVSRLVLMCSISPRSAAPYDKPEERRALAESRIDPIAVRRLEELQQAGMEREQPIAFCREHRNVYTRRQMGKPEALARGRSDPCASENEWPRNIAQHWSKHFPLSSMERDWRSALRSLAVPTLVIHGDEDLIPLESSQDWAATMPAARLLVISGAGHYPHLECPQAFFPAVSEFLEGGWPDQAMTIVS